jgi:hypothetical protein
VASGTDLKPPRKWLPREAAVALVARAYPQVANVGVDVVIVVLVDVVFDGNGDVDRDDLP